MQDPALRRDLLFGYHGNPGTARFKAMVRRDQYKLIWMANGPHALLFDVASDPHEVSPIQDQHPQLVAALMAALIAELRNDGVDAAFENDELRTFEYAVRPLVRIDQFDLPRGVTGFPATPAEVHYEPTPSAVITPS